MRTNFSIRQLMCFILILLALESAESAVHQIVIENMKFVPETLTIQPGDEVRWINKDFLPHTATQDQKVFDSKEIPAGSSWSHRFRKTGTFHYICSMHPTMKGQIHVTSK